MFKSFTDGFSGWIVGKVGTGEPHASEASTCSAEVAASADHSGEDAVAPALDETISADGNESARESVSGTAEGDRHASKDGKGSLSDAVRLDELTDVAKQWGNYLLSVGKAATKTVTSTALEIKKSVGEKTILGDFAKEQEKFVNEKRERQQRSEAAVPPWVGYNEEETMKQQILGLSTDKRNFLRNPPTGVQFHFDYDTCYPVAIAMLTEDENLSKMRFDLVPKQVNEHDFWRNYFYRVSLIKQSAQLTSMAKQSSGSSMAAIATGEQKEQRKVLPANKDNGKTMASDEGRSDRAEVPTAQTLPQDEFISDDYQGVVNDDDLRKEMEALRVKDGKQKEPAQSEDTPEWEKELQKELNEYEVIGSSGGGTDDGLDIDDAELEKEILEQIADSKM